MADGLAQINRPLSGGQIPVADFHRTEFFARGTGLGLANQLSLFDRKIFDDVASDGLPNFTGRGFDASERSFCSSDVFRTEIDIDFFGESFHRFLVFR